MTPFDVAVVNWIRMAFVFEGRASRSDYWWTRLLVFGVNIALATLFLAGGGLELLLAFLEVTPSGDAPAGDGELSSMSSLSLFAFVFAIIFGLLTFIPDLAISWRRFHDLGQPGWLHLIFFGLSIFVSLFTLVQLIWFAFPGTSGSNRFGPDPLANEVDIFD